MNDSLTLNFVVTAHKILVYFIAFGCFLPVKYLPYHLAIWPIVYIHWKFNNNKCVLTQLEAWMRDGTCMDDAPKIGVQDDDFQFTRKVLSSLNITLTNEDLDKFIYVVFSVSWIISFYRYINHKKV